MQCSYCGFNLASLYYYLSQMKTTSSILKEAHKYYSYHNHPIIKYCSKCNLNLCNQFNNHE